MNSMTPSRLSPFSRTNCRSTSTDVAFLTEKFLFHYSSLDKNSTKEDLSNNSFLPDRLFETKTPTISNNNQLFRQSLVSRFVLPPRKHDLASSDLILQSHLPMCSRQLTETFEELQRNKQQEQKSIAVSIENQESSMKCNVGLTFKLNQLLGHCSKYKSDKSRVHNGSCNNLKADKNEGSCLDGTSDCTSSTNLEDLRCLRDHSKEQLLGVTKCKGLPLKEHPAQDIFERQSRPPRTKHVKHHKRGQILNTPSPVRHFDCFQNGSNGEDVEEPIIFVPNYFMDLETEPNCKMLSQDNNPTTSNVSNGERPIKDKELKNWNELYGMSTMETPLTDITGKRDACFQVVSNQGGLWPPNTYYDKRRTRCKYVSTGSLIDASNDSTFKNYATDVSKKRKHEKYDKPSWAHNSELFGDSNSDNISDRNSSFIHVAFPSTLSLSPVKPGLGLHSETSTKSTDSHSTLDKMKNTGNIIHKCKACDKKIGTFSNLTRNSTALHAAGKPYVCQHCSKRFNRSSIHRYTHTGEKPHKCSTCGRGFKQLTHLTYHMRTHSDVKTFNCEFCGKGFNQKSNLQAHIYGHTGERPHKCEVCNKGFTLTSTLNTHRRTHAVTKPFQCGICHKAFYQKNALKTHYISSHPLVNGVCLL